MSTTSDQESGAGLAPDVLHGLVAIAADEEAHGLLASRARSYGHCAEPVRLTGHTATIDERSGEVIEAFASDEVAGGEVLKPCGTRRASRCPSWAALYQGDARQLVRAGLLGGKGVDESVAFHPMVFATLTAPSFGAVHRAAPDRAGRARRGDRDAARTAGRSPASSTTGAARPSSGRRFVPTATTPRRRCSSTRRCRSCGGVRRSTPVASSPASST